MQSIDELVPSLRKIRKLAGIFSFCFPDMYIITLHDFRTTILFFLSILQHRITGHAFEIHYISLGMWGAVLLWFCIIRGMMNLAINALYIVPFLFCPWICCNCSILINFVCECALYCNLKLMQVVDFIKAIFTDSPLRKDCLWKIESADFM